MALIEENNSTGAIDILLAKYLSGEANALELAKVEAWIAESEDNKKNVEALNLIWAESKKFLPGKKPDIQEALDRFRERIAAKPVVSISRMQWVKIAAIIILIAGMAAILVVRDRPSKGAADIQTIIAGNVERTDTLPDGSVVRLLPTAELQYPARFASMQRDVALKGNAFFSVVHDPQKPFEIAVNDVKIIVVGTSFKVFGNAGITEVRVITGVVKVVRKERSINVFPHEKLLVPASGDLWIKQTDTVVNPESLQKEISKSQPEKPIAKSPAAPVNDYEHQRQSMLSIIDDVVKEKIMITKESINWIALTDSVLIINGTTQPEMIHQLFKKKYLPRNGEGYYYGPVQVTGKGYFFDKKDFSDK
jgi:transmembrane sensor